MDFFEGKRIAIIADWLIDFWWAELVLSHLLELYPEADIYTSVCYMEHPMLEWRNVYTSWLQKIPFFNRRHKLAGILRPFAFRSFNLSGYDVVICSSSAESKQVAMGKWNHSRLREEWSDPENKKGIPSNDWIASQARNDRNKDSSNFKLQTSNWKPLVIVYCHTPIRYYWSHYAEYRQMMEFWWLNPIARFVLDRLIDWLRKLDYEAAQRVDYFIANSRTTQERIQIYYNRESEVIYPGINIWWKKQNGGSGGRHCLNDDENNKIVEQSQKEWVWLPPETFGTFGSKSTENGIWKEGFYLGVGRCIPYKKFDLLVEAFNQNGKKLILCTATDTPLFRELKAKSKPNIEWRFRISNEEKNELMSRTKAFLFPPEEDFGLVPVEAMIVGTPVIAYGKWGATETVVDSKTGLFFSPQTPEALNEAIEQFEKMEWNRETIRNHAENFSKERFQEKIRLFIANQN